jgi:hypothetical protein
MLKGCQVSSTCEAGTHEGAIWRHMVTPEIRSGSLDMVTCHITQDAIPNLHALFLFLSIPLMVVQHLVPSIEPVAVSSIESLRHLLKLWGLQHNFLFI